MTRLRRTGVALAASLVLLLTGCGGSDDEAADDDGAGLSKADLTDRGEDECAFDAELRRAAEVAGFTGEIGPYPQGFDQVILHVGDQDYADSADSTDLFDVRGALQICRYSLGDDYVLEGYLYWFAPTADRSALEDAEAWTYAYADVAGAGSAPAEVGVDAPVPVRLDDERAAVTAVRASGGAGASAALSITVDGFVDDPAAAPRSLTAKNLSGPLPPEDQVVDLLGAIAEQLSDR